MSTLPSTMQAVQTLHPGPPSVLQLATLPLPTPSPGQVLIKVKAIGLNRSELFTRQGHSPGVQFPRVQGIEATGFVAACPGKELSVGDVVITCMGEMGRAFDGGYAEYTCVPVKQVRRVTTNLHANNNTDGDPTPAVGWAVLGAIPEMVQTAWGSLVKSLQLKAGDRLLIRGGTSSVGLAASALAKDMGAHVTSTTRRKDDDDITALLRKYGADTIIHDDGAIAQQLTTSPSHVKFDKVLELIGTVTLRDSLACTRIGGIVCNTGILGNTWQLAEADRNPMDLIPTGVMLTVYAGSSSDMMDIPVEEILRSVEEGKDVVPVGKIVRGLEGIKEAHELMERNAVNGKVVVLV